MKGSSTLVFSKQGSEDDVALGDFEIHAVLGQGQFGRVYLAELERGGKT